MEQSGSLKECPDQLGDIATSLYPYPFTGGLFHLDSIFFRSNSGKFDESRGNDSGFLYAGLQIIIVESQTGRYLVK
jgi:hypothetical protein